MCRRPSPRLEDSINLNIKEIQSEGVDWTVSEWGSLVGTRHVPEKAGNSVTNSAAAEFSKVLSQRYQVN